MTRRLTLITIALLAAGALLAGCTRMVQVETGERITCTYGEVVTDTVKTIEVAADKAANYHVVVNTVTCERHKRLEALYAEAQAAIVAGDLATARAKLVEVVTIEPLFKNARQQLDTIDDGGKPVADTSANTSANTPATPGSPSTPAKPGAPGTPGAPATATPSPGAGQEPVGPVASLSSWVPDALPGYTATPIIADVYVLTREYLPTPSAPTYALVAVVEQYKDATAAKGAIKNDMSNSYPVASTTLTIKGRSVYFGTDGKRRAIVAWNESGVLVAIEGAVKTGSPTTLKSHLSDLVGAIVK